MANNQKPTYNGIERFIFSDVYVFFTKYKDIRNEDFYWETLLNDAKILLFKYKNHPLARGLVASAIDQLEHVVNKTTLNGYTREQWEQILVEAHKFGW